MSDATDSMYVEFFANYDDLDSAENGVSAIFSAIAESAAASSAEISGSFEEAGEAANSFAEMSQMAAENMAEALDSASGSFPELMASGDSAGSSLIEILLNIDRK